MKAIKQAQTRHILEAYNREDISYSRMNEIFNELSDEFTIGFISFIHKYFYKCENSTYHPNTIGNFESKYYTVEELLQIYKSQL